MRTNSIRAICALIGIVTITTTTYGQCTLEPIGELRTLPGAFAVNAQHAFVELNGDLVAYDLTALGTPLRVGQLSFDDYVSGVALAGDLAFVASNGLRVVDISDPAAMQVVGVFEASDLGELPSGAPLHWNGLVCAASHSDSLLVFDVSDPREPTLISNTETGAAPGSLAAFDDGRAYLLDDGELSIWDVGRGASPALAGAYNFDASVRMFAVRSHHAYVSGWNGTSRILDVSDPARVEPVGEIPGVSGQSLLAVDGSLLVVSDPLSLSVFSLSEPSSPQLLAQLRWEMPSFYYIAAGGGQVLLSNGGIVVVNAQIAGVPRYAGHILETGSWMYSYAVENDRFYAAEYLSELEIYQVGDDGVIDILGHWRVPDYCIGTWCVQDRLTAVQVSNGFVFAIAQHRDGVLVIDATDPHRPSLVQVFAPDAHAVSVVEQRAFVLEDDQFVIYSVENPRQPVMLGALPLEEPSRMWIHGDRAYVATNDDGRIDIVDIADAAAPAVLGTIPLPNRIGDLAAFPPYIIFRDWNGNVSVFDTSDPASPVEVPILDSYGTWYSIEVRGSRAYVCSNRGFRVLDIADPARPVEIAEWEGDRLLQGFALQGDRAIVLGHTFRLAVVPLPSAGDIDGNGVVDLSDLTTLLGNFSAYTEDGPAAGDLDCNRRVELNDLAMLLANYGR